MSLRLMSVVPVASSGQNLRAEESELLLKLLLECVQSCQKRFGGKTELATEFDSCVIALCLTLEQVLLHGLRVKPLESPLSSTLKQVTDRVVNTLSLSNETQLSFWPFVKSHLSKHENERYRVLKNIYTDVGRSRAWIRACLNERSLSRYFETLLKDANSLKIHYEHWALLRDHDKSSMLPNMAAGLAAILFAISIDKPELDSPSIPNKLSGSFPKSEPIIEASIPVPDQGKQIKDKRKKKVARQFISFDEDISSSSFGSASSETSSSNSGKFSQPPTVKMEADKTSAFSSVVPETLTPIGESSVGELTPLPNTGEDRMANQEEEESSDESVETPFDVSVVLTNIEQKNNTERRRLQEKIDALSMENVTLKEQVKKYLDALKLLGKGDEELPDLPNYKQEAKIFEMKLVQVAEMHAELMDFNVHLQHSICEKDALLDRFKRELEILRGPVAEDDEEPNGETGTVHVWIPSAFLTGPANTSHHVYQVFLRAGNDEWNIYRRYAEFHALHADLKKIDPAVGSFDFPPKKTIGRRDASLVEDRRKRLQTYLRRILSHWPELHHCSSKVLLEQHLSFFKDERNEMKNKRNEGRQSTSNSYTGL